MIRNRRRLAAVVPAVLLAIGAPVPGARALGAEALPTDTCGHTSVEGQAATAGTTDEICVGSGLVQIGPAVGQAVTLAGPTITGSATIGTSVVSAGDVATRPMFQRGFIARR
jgi:hypothetical protein